MACILRLPLVRLFPLSITLPGRTHLGGRTCPSRGGVHRTESARIGAGSLTVGSKSGGRVSRPLNGRAQTIPPSTSMRSLSTHMRSFFLRRWGLVVAVFAPAPCCLAGPGRFSPPLGSGLCTTLLCDTCVSALCALWCQALAWTLAPPAPLRSLGSYEVLFDRRLRTPRSGGFY